MARSSTSFRTGQSGNQGGRPKQVAAVRAQAQEHCGTAVQTLVALMRNADPRIRLNAACAVLDRAVGRPAIAEDERESEGKILKIVIPDYRKPAQEPALRHR